MYSFTAVPDRPPHCCISCKVGKGREWFLDLGESVEDPSTVMPTIYVCNLCLTAAVKEKGLVDQEPLQKKITELENELFDYKTKAEGLEQGLAAFLRAGVFDPNGAVARELGHLWPAAPDASGGLDSSGDPMAGGQQPTGEHAAGADGEPAEPSDDEHVAGVLPGIRLDAGGAA